MLLVLCRDPLEPGRPDRAFTDEIAAIERLGLSFVLVDQDALVRGEDAARVVRRVAERAEPVVAIYRGWMVTPAQYQVLYDALLELNIRLINDPEQYRHCHYLPDCYSVIAGFTPRTVWLTGDLGADELMRALVPFGDGPIVVKDFVKSRKHEWAEACFIPCASDRGTVERVVGRFLELQADDLQEGLVFREFIPLKSVGVHSKSGMPLAEEYRIFWLDARPVCVAPYWDVAGYVGNEPPVAEFAEIAAKVRSRFFSMDVAPRLDGTWVIVELGDGQVSGLTDAGMAERFYAALSSAAL